jgi:hypothetical protein
MDTDPPNYQGYSTPEMLLQVSFDPLWDFATIWQINEGSSYPYLQWQSGAFVPAP